MLIPHLNIASTNIAPEALSALFDNHQLGWQPIDNVNWQEYPYRPEVKFRIAYGDDCFLLQYHVQEETVRARFGKDNGDVWTDSCVEFFLRKPGESVYYNCECNCIGTILLGCGEGRDGRQLADESVTARIKRYSTLGREPFEERKCEAPWEVSLVIPTEVYFKSQWPKSLRGLTFEANFYKCGDELQRPHFLSWSPIPLPSPNFHCPQFFGTLEME